MKGRIVIRIFFTRCATLLIFLGALTSILLVRTVIYGQAVGTPRVTTSGQPEIYFVPDVAAQFNQLALRPDALAFGIDGQPDPSTGQHFQGIVRRHGPGTPYMFASRSGSDVDECFPCTNDPGNIYIVKMGSRDTNGERLRSNRLRHDSGIAGTVWPGFPNFWPTPPDPLDKTVFRIDFNGQNGWPNYGHPGGLQMLGDVLMVPLTDPYTSGDPAHLILFIDVSNPEAPALKSRFNPLQVSPTGSEFGAGQVAVTPVLNPNGPGVRYILLLSGEANKDVRLYRSLPTSGEGWTDLKSTDLSWEFIGRWTHETVTSNGADAWPDTKPHQMFNFVRQESLSGPLFLIAARNSEPVLEPGGGTDYLHLYRVHVDQYGNPNDTLLTQIERKHVATNSIGGGGDTSHFTGSVGTYVSPSGELIIYACEHDNDGPPSLLPGNQPGDATVRFGEWRHREMVRPGSPTLKPSVEALSSFEVDEGSTTLLNARGKAPITKAWIQFFEDDGVGLSLPGLLDSDVWLAVDYQDELKDDFDNFTKLLWFFNDNAGSWRWFAPAGCTLHVNEHSINDSDFPGRRKTLFGTGLVEVAADLDAVMDDAGDGSMNDMISSVQFFCDAYYNVAYEVAWDLDLNGTFETIGILPSFSAAELDGPSFIPIPLRAQHPTDTTPLGTSAPATLNVRIRNVAPNIASLNLVDPLGFKVGIDVPFALVNLKYSAESPFTDPGKPDHQTAQLDMGDGTILQSSAFDLFSDAFGGVTGQVRQSHRYKVSGTYTIRLDVTDDDGGVTGATRSVTVVTPAQVIQWVINEIDQRLATATNQTVIRALRDARNNLTGNKSSSANNGALDALASGDLVAALEKIKAAIQALQRAEAAGAGDLSNLKNLLGLAGESVAQGAYQDAVDAVGTPSQGEATQLQRIIQSITDGHARLENREYVLAIDLFKDAVGRARSLL